VVTEVVTTLALRCMGPNTRAPARPDP